jgi:hypothetical protein
MFYASSEGKRLKVRVFHDLLRRQYQNSHLDPLE